MIWIIPLSKCSKLACKVNRHASSRYSYTDPHITWPEDAKTMCMPFWSTLKKCQNTGICHFFRFAIFQINIKILRSSGICHFFRFAIFHFKQACKLNWHASSRHSHTQILTAPGWKMSRNFAFKSSDHLEVEYCNSKKVPESWNPQVCNIPV